MSQPDLEFNLKDALTRTQITDADLAALREPPVPGVPTNITDKQLVLFRNACHTIKATRNCMKNYYDIKRSAPTFFNGQDATREDLSTCLDNLEFLCLPPTTEGYNVIFHRLHTFEVSLYNHYLSTKTLLMTLDASLSESGPSPGLIILYDMRGASISHLTRVSLRGVHIFFKYLQEALPAECKAIHVLNTVSFLDKVLFLIKPFMKKEVFDMVHFHPRNMNMEDFYQFIPKSSLPSDYGGDLQSTRELCPKFAEKLKSLSSMFKAEEEQRMGTCKTIEMNSQFDKLEID